jgi:hypothetical protein
MVAALSTAASLAAASWTWVFWHTHGFVNEKYVRDLMRALVIAARGQRGMNTPMI